MKGGYFELVLSPGLVHVRLRAHHVSGPVLSAVDALHGAEPAGQIFDDGIRTLNTYETFFPAHILLIAVCTARTLAWAQYRTG